MNREETVLKAIPVKDAKLERGNEYYCVVESDQGNKNQMLYYDSAYSFYDIDQDIRMDKYVTHVWQEVSLSSLVVKGEEKMGGLNLVEIENKIDELLNNETPESLKKWLKEHSEKVEVEPTLREEEILEKFLKFVDEKTYFFEDKDVTIAQVVTEFLRGSKG